MKTSIKCLVVLLSIVVLAGCKSCPCSKTVEAAPVAPVVAAPAPVAPAVAAPAETEEAQAPKAVRQYIK